MPDTPPESNAPPNPYADAVKQRAAEIQAQQPDARPEGVPPAAFQLAIAGDFHEAGKMVPRPDTPPADPPAPDNPSDLLTAAANGGEVPTEADLCGWLTDNGSTILEADGRCLAWLPMRVDGAVRLYLVTESIPAPGVQVLQERDGGRWLAFEVLGGIEAAQPDWLADLVSQWQNQAVPVERNRRNDRTFPARVGMITRGDSRAGRLFTPALHAADGGQLVLPGFGADVSMPTPALPLALYDLGVGNSAESRGRGAPLALRLWIEAVLSVRIPDRAIDRPVVLSITLRELLAKLYPGRRPSPAEYWPRLMAAVEALESQQARIPWEDPATGKGGLRRVVSVSNIPRGLGALEDDVRLIVDLPPGAHDGPIVSPNLPQWGVKSAAAYRALIGLAFRWWNPGVTRRPVGRGKGRYWYQSDNPADYGGKLTDAEAIALCFPTSTRAERRKLAFEAWRVLRMLAAAGETRDVNGNLLPPKGGDNDADC